LGIEALSRGATSALFVEENREACRTIQSNLRTTRLEQDAEVFEGRVEDALGWLARQKRRFDLIFADPPYAGLAPGRVGWLTFLISCAQVGHVLAEDGRLLIEHSKKE